MYGEFYSVVTGDSDSTLAGFIDTGLVYQIRPNAEAAPDYQPFAGFSFRF